MSHERDKSENGYGLSSGHGGLDGMSVPPSRRSKEEAWDLLLKTIEKQQTVAPRVVPFNRSKILTVAIAASVAITLFVAGYLALTSAVRVDAPVAQSIKVSLPDGSSVYLNQGSWIQYSRLYGWLNRNLTLDGEAYFVVVKGRGKFVVSDPRGQKVEATGTEFFVLTRTNLFAVKCFEGSVKLKAPGIESISLSKGQGIERKGNLWVPVGTSSKQISKPVWVTKEFYFVEQSLQQVFEEISDYYKISIKAEGFNPESRLFTGTVPANRLTEVLDIISLSTGLTYSISSDSTLCTLR